MENKSILTIKNLLRAFALLLIIFVFCPSFLVSCSGQEIGVSVANATFGISRGGEKLVEPHFIMIFAVIIPFVIMGVLFVKTLKEKVCGIIIEACAGVDFILQIVFRVQAKKMAEDNYCDFKTTGWYVLNFIVLLLVLLINLLVVLEKKKMDDEIKSIFVGTKAEGTVSQITNVVSAAVKGAATAVNTANANGSGKAKEVKDRIGFCQKCGSPIEYGCSFCTSCGTAVPKELIEQAEATKKALEEKVQSETPEVTEENNK